MKTFTSTDIFKDYILNILVLFNSVRAKLLETVKIYFAAAHIQIEMQHFVKNYLDYYEIEELFHAIVECFTKVLQGRDDNGLLVENFSKIISAKR